jgi:hypothetical protein
MVRRGGVDAETERGETGMRAVCHFPVSPPSSFLRFPIPSILALRFAVSCFLAT